MNKIKFFLRGNTVYVWNKVQGKLLGVSTKVKLSGTMRLKDNRIIPFNDTTKHLNTRLNEIENIYNACFIELGNDITYHKFKSLFTQLIKGNKAKGKDLAGIIDHYIEGIKNGSILSSQNKAYGADSTRSMKTSLMLIKEFTKDMTLRDIDKNTSIQFIQYINKNKDSAINTVRKHIKVLKTFGKHLYNEGYIKLDYSRDWKKPQEPETFHIYLTEEEVEKVRNCTKIPIDIIHYQFLFLVQCYSGLRVSDLLRIRLHHIKKHNSKKTLQIKAKKTGKEIIIPLGFKLQNALINYIEASQGINITEQDYNKHLKTVCFTAGIDDEVEVEVLTNKGTKTAIKPKWEVVSSHTCRRTALTNLYIKKLPRSVLMQISGHKTESSLNKYLKQSGIDLFNDIDMDAFQ